MLLTQVDLEPTATESTALQILVVVSLIAALVVIAFALRNRRK